MNERAAIRKASRDAKADQMRRDNAIRAMLQHSDTRYYLSWLLEIGLVGQQPFVPDPHATGFNCGQLNVGNQILAHILEVDLDGYVLMRKEMENERRNRAQRPDDSSGDDDPFTDSDD